jgi:hypothetical protein
MVSSWRSSYSWARGGFVKADVALIGGTHGSFCSGFVWLLAFPRSNVFFELIELFTENRESVRVDPSLFETLRLLILVHVVNTFTEHRGNVWSVKDMQHTCVFW